VPNANLKGAESDMRDIELDATNWTTAQDFYNALLSKIGAPKFHGRNINALVDSMIWGGINKVDPPYTVRIRGVAQLSKDVRDHVELAENALRQARAEFHARNGREVQVQFETCA
jgi:RNAse (barnase) inhibitor barstar